eukprot:ANDGO_02418.mRNA.1 hypothetical protein
MVRYLRVVMNGLPVNASIPNRILAESSAVNSSSIARGTSGTLMLFGKRSRDAGQLSFGPSCANAGHLLATESLSSHDKENYSALEIRVSVRSETDIDMDLAVLAILQIASKLNEQRSNHLTPQRIRTMFPMYSAKQILDFEMKVLQKIEYNLAALSTSFHWIQTMTSAMWLGVPACDDCAFPVRLQEMRTNLCKSVQKEAFHFLAAAMFSMPELFMYSGKTIAASCVSMAVQQIESEVTNRWAQNFRMNSPFLFLHLPR